VSRLRTFWTPLVHTVNKVAKNSCFQFTKANRSGLFLSIYICLFILLFLLPLRVNKDEHIALCYELLISKALKTARVNKGWHSFTCHSHVYPRMQSAILPLLPSRRAPPQFGRNYRRNLRVTTETGLLQVFRVTWFVAVGGRLAATAAA